VNRTKARICIVHTGPAAPQMFLGEAVPHAGGAELQLAEIARRLSRRGWPVTFALRDSGQLASSADVGGIRVIRVKLADGGVPLLRFLWNTLPANLHLVRHADADVFLAMGVRWQSGLLAWACRGRGRRFLLWLASFTDPMFDDPKYSRLAIHERWLARYGLRHADVIVAQTRDQQRLLREHQGRESVLIRNIWPIDDGGYVPPRDPPEVFWAATVRELKRPHLFLDVAEALPSIQFVMAGGPAEGNAGLYDQVKARAESMPNVRFLGFVPFREIDKYYAQASVYLCTSTIEGFPNTFLQAWSHGRPVVSTFDPDEVICEHNLGFHCHDTDELVSAVRTACENSSDYAERVHTYLRTYHSPEVIMPQIESVLLQQ